LRVQKAPKKFHFLGICGTAMGAVAAGLGERGFKVSGSDENVYPPMSIFLEEKEIALKEGFRPENIPNDVDVVVVGNAMKRGNRKWKRC
jgi:UDP-N-acetylmuramate: L-alanyl-gamma-D-glutamyl-meso-diaminopimelate ligase